MPPEPRRLLERFPAELLHCCGALLLQRFHRIPTLPSLLPMTAPTLISAHLRQVGRAYARLQRSIAQRLRVSLSRRRTRAAACVGLLGLAFGGAALALVAGPNLRNYSSEVTVVRMPVETPDLAEEIRSAVRIGDRFTSSHSREKRCFHCFLASASKIRKPMNSSRPRRKLRRSGCLRRDST